jgi:chemotaxis signal transduction protein
MATSPAARRVLIFTAGVRLALRLPSVREILAVEAEAPEVVARGQVVAAVPLAAFLGAPSRPARFAVLTEGDPPVALRVEQVHGIADLAQAEVYQLPARTLLPQPPPFQAAVVLDGAVALELALTAAGWVPLEPAEAAWEAPPEDEFPAGRELVFSRGRRRFAVPISLLSQVIEGPRVFPVPLAPRAHRGLLCHGRALHPVFDLAALYDGAPVPGAAFALLVDAGGTPVAILADRVGAEEGGEVVRPAWDLLFPA